MQTPEGLYTEIIGRIYANELMGQYQEQPGFKVKVRFAMRRASEEGNLDIVKSLLGLGIAFTPEELNDALCVASLFGHKRVVESLLKKEFKVTEVAARHAAVCCEINDNEESQKILRDVLKRSMSKNPR